MTVTALGVAAVLAVGVAACGGETTTTVTQATPTASSSPTGSACPREARR